MPLGLLSQTWWISSLMSQIQIQTNIYFHQWEGDGRAGEDSDPPAGSQKVPTSSIWTFRCRFIFHVHAFILFCYCCFHDEVFKTHTNRIRTLIKLCSDFYSLKEFMNLLLCRGTNNVVTALNQQTRIKGQWIFSPFKFVSSAHVTCLTF